MRRKSHRSVVATLQSGLDTLMTFRFMFLGSLQCSAETLQTPVRSNRSLLVRVGNICCLEKSCASNKPINIKQRNCSLSVPEWAAHCILSRQLNFRQLNILGNVWKLNCEGEQRRVARMKRCGETQKAPSYRRSTQSHANRGAPTQTHTLGSPSTYWQLYPSVCDKVHICPQE